VVRRATFAGLVDAISRLVSASDLPSDAERRAVIQALLEAGIQEALDELQLAERIILAGEGFHSIERFFVEGSAEQRFVGELVRRSARRPEE
jgi:hypothetical protein